MASHYYGVNKGAGSDPNGGVAGQAIATDTSTTSKAVELVTLDGAGLTRQEVLNAIKMFESYFMNPSNTVTP